MAEGVRRFVAGFPRRWPGLDPRTDHVKFVENKVPLEQAFSNYNGLPCKFSFNGLLHTHLSSWAGTISPLVANVPN
jgi:hypothetical protein